MKLKLIIGAVLVVIVVVMISTLSKDPGTATTPGKPDRETTESTDSPTDGSKTRISRNEPGDTVVSTPGTATVARTPRASNPATAVADDDPSKTENLNLIAETLTQYGRATDIDAKADLISKLGDIPDVEAVKQLLALLQNESDPDLRYEILQALQWNEAREQMGTEIVQALENYYKRSSDLSERITIQETIGEMDTPQAVRILKEIYANNASDPEEKLAAAESLMRMHSRDDELLSSADAQALNEQLRIEFQALTEPHLKNQALMALAEMRMENKEFFQQMLTSEQDPTVRRMLEQLVTSIAKIENQILQQQRQGQTQPPAGTTPAATATPSPTPGQ